MAHAPELALLVLGSVLVGVGWLTRGRDAERAMFARRVRIIGIVMVALAVAWLGCVACRAYLHRTREVMHRVRAGTRGADNWVAATSTKGRFEVRLPAEFNDFSSVSTDRVGRIVTTHALVAVPGTNIIFAAQLIRVAGPDPKGENAFMQFEADRIASSSQNKLRPFTHEGFPGLDSITGVMTPAGPATLFMRRVRAVDALYMLTVTCPTNSASILRKPAAYFFESLKTR